jgi:predicted metal-dependent hydrolase
MPALPANLKIVRHPRARRMKLRIDKADGAPVLVLPTRASLKHGQAFVHEHLAWIAERQAARPAPRPFEDGVVFQCLDRQLCICHSPDSRSGVRLVDENLVVSGETAHVNRRVIDWLKREARHELTLRAHAYAEQIGTHITRIRIADQKSRWGSCATGGVLSFNWRLILAPENVLDFVAAHEVAHMREMNHGPGFHRLVSELHHDARGADHWLKQHGPALRAWGQTAQT